MRGPLALAGVAATAALALAACSSSPTTTSGTETWSGQQTLTSAQLSNDNFQPTYPMKFTGPVHATANFTPPGGNAVKVQVTFHTTAGNLVVNADLPGNSNSNAPPSSVSGVTCVAAFDLDGTYTVVGSKSTGSFKGATGHGTVRDVYAVTLPRVTVPGRSVGNGGSTCNESGNAVPTSGWTSLVVSGPMTVKS